MMDDDNDLTAIRGARQGRRGRSADPVLRAKLMFLGVAAAVLVLLAGSFLYAAKARSERNALSDEMKTLRNDNARLAQQLDERIRQVASLKKQIEKLQGRSKPKQASTSRKQAPKKISAAKRTTSSTRR